MSPSMFRNPTINKPDDSPAVAMALDKLAISFIRSHANKHTNIDHLSSKNVREALSQLDSGFKNALRNNLIRLHGQEHYDVIKRELDGAFYSLIETRVTEVSELALSAVNQNLEIAWEVEATRCGEEETAFELQRSLVSVLTSYWQSGHASFAR